MSSQTDPAGGPAAPPEPDEDEHPSMAAALSRVETLVSALEADGVRVSEVTPALAPEHLRDGYVTVSLTLGLRLDERQPTLANSDSVRTLDSAEGMPGTSAGSAATDGGAVATTAPAPRAVDGDLEPAVREIEADEWYCSVCGHGPFPRNTIHKHRYQEDRCADGEPVAEEPEDTIPAISEEAWFCSECDYGPATRQGVKVHAGHAHDGEVEAVLDEDEPECEECGETFENEQGLNAHRSTTGHDFNQLDDRTLADYGDHLDVEAAIEGLTGVQTIHEVQRDLRIQRDDARKLVKRLGFFDDLKRGREGLERDEVSAAVTGEFEEVGGR